MVFRATGAVNDLRPLSRRAPEGSASLTASVARNRAPPSDRRKGLVAWLVVVAKLRALSICILATAAPSFFDRSPSARKVARWRSGNEKVKACRQKLRRCHCRRSVAAPTTSDNRNDRLPRRIVQRQRSDRRHKFAIAAVEEARLIDCLCSLDRIIMTCRCCRTWLSIKTFICANIYFLIGLCRNPARTCALVAVVT
jgi:hypothetical protein